MEAKDGATVIGVYEYDALNRRVKRHVDSQAPDNPNGIDTYLHYFYNSAWQVLETRDTTTESDQPENLQPDWQYIWSPRYIDAPVLRDKNTDADGLCDDERIYYLGDANFNVTTLVDTGGDAVERYLYEPYGKETIYDGTWESTRSASSYGNVVRYTGREWDEETGICHYRRRYLHMGLARFLGRDYLKFSPCSPSTYAYTALNPGARVDPFGLDWSVHRYNGPRAYATCEIGDTVWELAWKTNLDPQQYRRWLRAEDGGDLPDSDKTFMLERRAFSIPNTVFVGVANMNWLARFVTGNTPGDIRNILLSKGYAVVYEDWRRIGRWHADDVWAAREDLYGLVYFGHGGGKGAKCCPIVWTDPDQTGWFNVANDRQISAGVIMAQTWRDRYFALLLLKACHAAEGGWVQKGIGGGALGGHRLDWSGIRSCWVGDRDARRS